MHIIAGKHKNKKLLIPKNIRPSQNYIKQQLFSIIGPSIEDSSFLDLFAGSGACGCEALSRGAKSVSFVEKSAKNCEIIKKNILTICEQEHSTLYHLDAKKALMLLIKKKLQYRWIFIDPPYATDELSYSNQIVNIIDQHSDLLEKEGTIFVEDNVLGSKEIAYHNLKLIKTRKKSGSILREFRRL